MARSENHLYAGSQNRQQLALRLRNIARAALLGGRQRLHASDEILVAKVHLLTQTGLPQRGFAFVCVSHQCGVLLRRTRAVTLTRYRAAQQIAVQSIGIEPHRRRLNCWVYTPLMCRINRDRLPCRVCSTRWKWLPIWQ